MVGYWRSKSGGETDNKQKSKRMCMSDGNTRGKKKKQKRRRVRARRGKAAILYGMCMRISRERASKERRKQVQRP